jgi:UDP-N-acetylglucosamine 2-epimerase
MPAVKILCVVGTRPEAIKMAPVVIALRQVQGVETRLVSTGQHKEILLDALATFGLQPDADLGIMRHGQTLASVTSRALDGLDEEIATFGPNLVVSQGDTTTAFVAGLAAFYRRVPFAHVEAGLRTDSIDNPFPEEFNRRAAGLIANLHFAPTTWARDNLLQEGKDPATVFVTGNTGIDAVLQTAARETADWFGDHPGRIILLTTHRRENWGDPQRRIARAARRILDETPDALLVAALHPNPQVREVVEPILRDHPRVRLIEPPDYSRFVKLMQRAALILSDSGGVQEEAPAFGIPVLVLRDNTERPEGVTAGTAQLVGTDEEIIFLEATKLLKNTQEYEAMARAASPYGDGRASERIRYEICRYFNIESPIEEMWA